MQVVMVTVLPFDEISAITETEGERESSSTSSGVKSHTHPLLHRPLTLQDGCASELTLDEGDQVLNLDLSAYLKTIDYTPTLQIVTDNGATTTNVISTAGYQVSGTALYSQHLTDVAALTTGYMPYKAADGFGNSGVFWDAANSRAIVSKIVGGTATTSDLYLQTTSEVGTTGADMHFLVGNNGATEAVTILNSGYVGIGETNPAYRLVAKGSVGALAHITDGTEGIIFTSSAGVMSLIGYQSTGVYNNLDIRTKITVGSQLYLKTDGNVGIGTNNPQTRLHVNAPLATLEEVARFSFADAANSYLSIQNASSVAGSFVPSIYGINGDDERQGITCKGDVADAVWTGDGDWYPAMRFIAYKHGTASLAGAPVVSFENNALSVLTSWFDGMTKIGGSDVISAAGSGAVKPSTMLDVINTNSQDLINLIDGSTSRFYIKAGGNVGIGTTDLDGTPAIGMLTVKGTTNNGTTNIMVGRDSDEANQFWVTTDGRGYYNAITLAAGTATAGTSPLNFTAGTNLTVPVSGTMEFDGTRWYGTDSVPTRNTFAWLSDDLADFGSGAATVGQIPVADGSGGVDWDDITGLPAGTNGDILYYNATWQVLAKGTDGDTLSLASGIPAWKTRWVEDTYGLTYTGGNVGINAASHQFAPLYVSDDNGFATIYGINTNYGSGVVGASVNGSGVFGNCITDEELVGPFTVGVYGQSTWGGGIYGTSSYNYAIKGVSGTSWGGYFTSTISGMGLYASSATIASSLSFLESAGATYYTTIKAGNQSADITYTLPTAAPAENGYALTATTLGVMSWAAVTSSQWTTDSYGINYQAGEVGIGGVAVDTINLTVYGNTNITNWCVIDYKLAVNSTITSGYQCIVESTTDCAIYGNATSSGYGIKAESSSNYGLYAKSTTGTALYATATGSTKYAIEAINTAGTGIYGKSTSKYGVYGISTSSFAVYGISTSSAGVYGKSTTLTGVYGISTDEVGVYGVSTNGYSGRFSSGLGVYITASTTNLLTLGAVGSIDINGNADFNSLLIGGATIIDSSGNVASANGVTGTWTTVDGKTITATNGIITSIV